MTNRRILSRLAASLEADALVKSFGNPLKALEWVKANTPDLVVTDFKIVITSYSIHYTKLYDRRPSREASSGGGDIGRKCPTGHVNVS